ncbi:uncharacterized protein il12rb1 isoform X3 [Toxotes jaculatrix]|uniref:uncharacterized protein il12rb1 isoform X3 n=1 Tax=Toxotes jaculatrix TaxID=941984 RepID=UPI001B3AF4F7|nr:uncharacterized protein il12rb1 isoform X3 [Toxotes jaculatrix]
MITFPYFPLYLMETLKCRSSLHVYVMFVFLTTVSMGSACEAPSAPECFRRRADDTVYKCEWSMNTIEKDVTFDLYFNETKFGRTKEPQQCISDELLIKNRPVNIWVEAHVGNSSCRSLRRSVKLKHIDQVIVVNLLRNSTYQVQIRHQSTKVQNPLWSKWSPVMLVPAALEHEPEVTMKTKLLNGTRKVMLTWKPMPHAAAIRGVTYRLEDTQSSHGCPCARTERRRHNTSETSYTTYVSYSAVNISVIAINAAGCSPSAIVQVPAKPAADLKVCDKTLSNLNLNKKNCKQWYELQDEDSRPGNVITLASKKKGERKKVKKSIKDYVRYLYFEHKCDNGKPRTVEMCLFYQKEGAPSREPQEFVAFSETHNSADLSWKAIATMDQRGFLTHYSLCSVKISSQDEPKDCHNISASLQTYHLENLTPGAKYNISLTGVTRVGEGPKATITINTLPEKPLNVWLSFGLLFLFFLSSTVCTVVLKRIANKVFRPVPMPVIPDFTPNQPENQQEMLDEIEEVHELTLLQLHPEGKSFPDEAWETTDLQEEWDDGRDVDAENESSDSRMSGEISDESPGSTDQALRSSREGGITDLEQVDNEIAMLIYRNGLVLK